MADSRQTKIVSYELQGKTTNLMSELSAAVQTLDALDKKLTRVAVSAHNIAGKDRTNAARAATISSIETQIEKLRASFDPRGLKVVSPDQLNLIKQLNVDLTRTVTLLSLFKSSGTVSKKALEKIEQQIKQMNAALKQANIEATAGASAWTKFTTVLHKAQVVIAAIRMLLRYIGVLYNATSEYVETMNLFNVATQDSTEKLYALAESMEEAYNTDIGPILKSMAVFRQYANTMGFAAQEADLFSEYLTKITYDLASLYNVANSDMMSAVRSALAGQTKPLMKYGISVHKATLEQYALKLGLEKSWTAFNETEKVALRYIAILDQASLAQGDLAKTLESPSNQLKIAKAQLQVFIRNLGSLVTTVGQYVLPMFNGLMIAVNNFMEVMSKAAGFTIPDYSDNLSANNQMLDDGTESAEEYEDAMKGVLAPIDEINQASTSDKNTLGSIDPKILEALKGYDNLMNLISTKTDIIAEAFGGILNPELFEGVGSVIGIVFDTFGAGVDLVAQALVTLSPVLSVVLDLLGLLLQGASWLVGNIVSPVLAFIQALTSNIWLLIAAFAMLNLWQLAVTGNWKAMTAVKIITMFKNLTVAVVKNTRALIINAAKAIASAAASAKNAVAKWIEAGAYWKVAVAAIAAAGSMALVVTGIVLAATSAAQAEANRSMSTTNVPGMASGGVVSGPTLALIGEGRYQEAVVPLGNSPQFKTMKDDIANEVLRKINPSPYRSGQPSRQSTPVILNLNGREIARAVLPDLGYVQPQTGVKLS